MFFLFKLFLIFFFLEKEKLKNCKKNLIKLTIDDKIRIHYSSICSTTTSKYHKLKTENSCGMFFSLLLQLLTISAPRYYVVVLLPFVPSRKASKVPINNFHFNEQLNISCTLKKIRGKEKKRQKKVSCFKFFTTKSLNFNGKRIF